uniref:Putative salivary lipocalin n=1 Tax=Ixodes ricinus TaxID=34613 RepID=A0A6B0UUC6_IXORI
MIALFLGILFLYHIQASSSKKNKGDYPDANEVMKNLPQTFMLQSLGNYTNLICGYQHFYNDTLGGQTYRKYDLIFKYPDRLFSQPLYVKNVTQYKLFMATRPESWSPLTYRLEILFSNMKTCMITRNPNPAFPKACNLMATKKTFF